MDVSKASIRVEDTIRPHQLYDVCLRTFSVSHDTDGEHPPRWPTALYWEPGTDCFISSSCTEAYLGMLRRLSTLVNRRSWNGGSWVRDGLPPCLWRYLPGDMRWERIRAWKGW